jgi:hypothetical protein
MTKLFLMAMLLVSCLSLFDESSMVFKLTESNFKSNVLMSEEFWLVEFYGTHEVTKRPGADTARNLHPSLRKLRTYSLGLSTLGPLI